MSRLRLLGPASLDVQQRAVYESIVGGRRAASQQHFLLLDQAGALTGPFNALLHAPAVGIRVSALGEAVRYETTLTNREREIAILTVAAVRRSSYEWYAHERVGRAVDVTEPELEALRARRTPDLTDAAEQAIHSVSATLAAGQKLGSEDYTDAVACLGDQRLVELVVLVGYYGMLATILETFDVDAPEGGDPFSGEASP